MDLAVFGPAGAEFIYRWLHFLTGVCWIGMLWYFNFVQGSFFAETEANVKTGVVQKLVPRALWWFRWGALGTWLTGVALLMANAKNAGMDIFGTSWGVTILTGALMGTYMFLNVWVIIWPAQKKVIAAANGESVPDAAAAGARAGLASRTNTLFSIPLLFFMGAAKHLPINIDQTKGIATALIVNAVIITLIEVNGLAGKAGPMKSVKGVISCGFILTAVLYGLLECLV